MTDLAEDTQADKVYDDAALTYKICDYLNFISMQKEKLQYESRIHEYEISGLYSIECGILAAIKS